MSEIQVHREARLYNDPDITTTLMRRMMDEGMSNHKHVTGGSVTTVVTLLGDMLRSEIVDTPDVARVLGTTARSVSRWASEGSLPRRDNEERLLELKAVIDALQHVMREESGRLWLRSPVPALDYRKPIDLIEQGEYRTVIGAILSIGEGVTA